MALWSCETFKKVSFANRAILSVIFNVYILNTDRLISSICKWKTLIKRSDFTFWPFLVFHKARYFCRERSRHFDILIVWFLLIHNFYLVASQWPGMPLYALGFTMLKLPMATTLTQGVAFSRFLVMTSLSRKKNPTWICRNTLSNLWPNMVVFSYDFCSIDSEFSYREQNYIFIWVFILKTFPVTSNSQQKKMSKSALFLLLDFTDDRTNTGKSNLGAVSLIRQ